MSGPEPGRISGRSPIPLAIGSQVILRSFNGRMSPPEGCSPGENYCLLINARGVVVERSQALGRLLVRFERPVAELGLHCHNAIPNSLYIRESDLEAVS